MSDDYRAVAGLHRLRLRGSFYQMGRQHGALLSKQIPRGPLFYYRDYLEKMFRSAGVATPVLCWLLDRTVGARVKRNMPQELLDSLRGLADGAGLDCADVLRGAAMPDSVLWVMARLMQYGHWEPATRHRLALGLGCTAAIAWGEATRNGALLHARNFDYYGVRCWPETQAVIFHQPERGQRYVSVAAAGVVLGGITAMNEAGLSMGVHQHMFTDGTRLGGTPIGPAGDHVMREAQSLDDAERILRQYRPIGAWTYLIADGQNKDVLCFEENPQYQRALRIGSKAHSFSYANIYLDPELGATEQNLYPSYWRANCGRQLRARELLRRHHGKLDPATMAGILADRGSGCCRLRDPIAMLMTVASVVFRPEDGVVWVATGETPTSCQHFEPFSLKKQDHAPEWGKLDKHIDQSENERRAFDAYRWSYIAYVDQQDFARARRFAEQARSLQPEQPLFHNVCGLLALRAEDADCAQQAFSAVIRQGHPDPERVAAAQLWRGRAHDLAGNRAQACRDYQTVVAAQADPAVRRAAEKGLRRRYPKRQARKLAVEYSFADVVSP